MEEVLNKLRKLSLAGIKTNMNPDNIDIEDLNSDIKRLALPEGVKKIAAYCMQKLEVKEVILPNSLETIGCGAFECCRELESVTIRNIRHIPNYCFSGCGRLRAVNITGNTQTIGFRAFSDCGRLKTIKLPETVGVIEERAFNESGLKEFICPKSLVKIGNTAFHNCTDLEKVEFNRKLKKIETAAFINAKFDVARVYKHTEIEMYAFGKIDLQELYNNIGKESDELGVVIERLK